MLNSLFCPKVVLISNAFHIFKSIQELVFVNRTILEFTNLQPNLMT